MTIPMVTLPARDLILIHKGYLDGLGECLICKAQDWVDKDGNIQHLDDCLVGKAILENRVGEGPAPNYSKNEPRLCKFCQTYQVTPCHGTHDALDCPVIPERKA